MTDPGTDAAVARLAAALLREAPGPVALTAAAPGEGVTTVTAAAARALVETFGQRVLAVGFEAGPRGLAARLPEAGAPGAAPLAAITLPATADGVAGLPALIARAGADRVLLDLPPYPDNVAALLGARAAGRAVLVARAGGEAEEVVRRALESLAQDGVAVMGVVLNAADPGLPRWLERLLR